MSDDIEVTVTLTPDEAAAALHSWAPAAWPAQQPIFSARRKIHAAIAALTDPVPPRSEYPCQSVTVAAGCTSVTDLGVVLVPAHSLRSGDEVEWAPGDWREIELLPPSGRLVSISVDGVAGAFWPFELVAVRRSGVGG